MEETNEELANFTISFEDDLAVLQASKSSESQWKWKQWIPLWELEVNLKWKLFLP